MQMVEKRLFWREFCLLWSAGAITAAIFAALVRIPTTPVATILLLWGHSQRSLLVGTEAIEITVELAIAVSCGLLAAHRIGLGAPIVERWLSGEPIKSQVRQMLVPSVVVGILLAVISMLPNLSVFRPVFHPNRELAHQEAERIIKSNDKAKLAEKLDRFVDERPLTLTSLTVSWLSAAIWLELFSRLFLLSIIALIFAKITGSPSGTANDRALFYGVLGVAVIGAIDYALWQSATTRMIYSSLGVNNIMHDPFWLVAARALLKTVPANVGLGWLYVRRGIESAILSAFVASVAAHLLFVVLVAVRFV